jgi:hypothetical protein
MAPGLRLEVLVKKSQLMSCFCVEHSKQLMPWVR